VKYFKKKSLTYSTIKNQPLKRKKNRRNYLVMPITITLEEEKQM